MTLDYGPFLLRRRVLLREGDVVFEDLFEFKGRGSFQEFRYFNFPVVIDKFKISLERVNEMGLFSDKGMIKVVLLDSDFMSKDFEIIESIKTAKGLACVVSLRQHNFEVKRGQKNHIRFSLNKLSSG